MLNEVFEKMERIVIFRFRLFGHEVEIGNTIFVTWVIMAIVILLALFFARNLSVERPGRRQCLAELFVETVNNLCKGSIGHHWKSFAPYIGTLLIYICFANMAALLNFIPGVHFYPPTKDINVTGALALISILVVFYSGFRYKGFKGWLKSLAEPIPVMVPFKLLEYITKPFSLCLRLFGNIVAGFIIMELVFAFIPIIAPPLSAFFDVFDAALQAFIFVYLTTLYIGEAVE